MNTKTIDNISVRQPSSRCILDSFCCEVKRKNIYCDSQGAGKGCPDNQKNALPCINALGFQFHTPTLTYDFSS